MIDKNNYSCKLLDPLTFKTIHEIKLIEYTKHNWEKWPMISFDEKDNLLFVK